MKGFTTRGWIPIVAGWRWVCSGSDPISDRRMELEFQHRAGQCRAGRSQFSAARCRICRWMEKFRSGRYRGGNPLGLFAGRSQLSIGRGGLGLAHRARRCRPGLLFFIPGFLEVRRDFRTGDGVLSSPRAAGLETFPQGQLPPRASRALIGRGREGGTPRPMGFGFGNRLKNIPAFLIVNSKNAALLAPLQAKVIYGDPCGV